MSKVRPRRVAAVRRLHTLEELSHALGFMKGLSTPGRLPKIILVEVIVNLQISRTKNQI